MAPMVPISLGPLTWTLNPYMKLEDHRALARPSFGSVPPRCDAPVQDKSDEVIDGSMREPVNTGRLLKQLAC